MLRHSSDKKQKSYNYVVSKSQARTLCAITLTMHMPPLNICARPIRIHLTQPLAPNSSDLNPVYYKIRGCLQDREYQKHIFDIKELKQHLVEVWSDFRQTITD